MKWKHYNNTRLSHLLFNTKTLSYIHTIKYLLLEHFLCTDEPRANTDSQDSPQPELGGNHHLPPYNILCAWPRDQHPNVILSQTPKWES